MSICDQYCAMHSITFNVKKFVCKFFRCSMNKTCDIANVVLSDNVIDHVHKTKYKCNTYRFHRINYNVIAYTKVETYI